MGEYLKWALIAFAALAVVGIDIPQSSPLAHVRSPAEFWNACRAEYVKEIHLKLEGSWDESGVSEVPICIVARPLLVEGAFDVDGRALRFDVSSFSYFHAASESLGYIRNNALISSSRTSTSEKNRT
eukprot:jgi/Botrbrau1/9012/Bobra.0148s0114.1